MSQAIESILHESRLFPPPPAFTARANVSGRAAYEALVARAQADHAGFWMDMAREHLTWHKSPTRSLDDTNAPFYKWFEDGEINVSWNCLDRHLDTQPDKLALIFEADDGKVTTITYRALYHRVCAFANALKAQGVKAGDRVLIYMPMSIEAVIAMQACARIAAIHSVVFGGFSAKSIQERVADAEAHTIITADGQFRGGREIALKNAVDEALAMGGCDSVEKVIVYKRTGSAVSWNDSRDLWWHDAIAGQPDECPATFVSGEHPLFILYTSGSTGKPKGVQHSSAGYLLGAVTSMRWVFDLHPDDIFWCTADVGWVTGHSYVAYGPLALGATELIFEGIPTYPDAGRFWKMIQDHKVSIFYTAPTAIRSLIKAGTDLPRQYDLASLRLLGTVGEPINPEAWMWYHTVVGQERCPIVDTWWQTETGCHMIAPLPGAIPTKPGSCTLPLPGIAAAIVDETGHEVASGNGGFLVIAKPWPSMLRTLWRDPERYQATYFPHDLGGKIYLAGDGAQRDEDGYFWIMGRIDDVMNVAGHRLGSTEIESALVANPLVAEAAVVSRPDDVTGEAVCAFVVLKAPRPTDDAEARRIADALRNWVTQQIGPIAKPKDFRFGDNLPKTRSGKIMRRLLRSIAKGEAITQDTTTLENPAILEQLKASAY